MEKIAVATAEPATELMAPTQEAPLLAWMQVDDELEPVRHRSWPAALGIAATVLIGAGAAVSAIGWTMHTPAPATVHVTSPSVIAASELPPIASAPPEAVPPPLPTTTTVTIQAAPPPAQLPPAPQPAETADQQFIDKMQSLGYSVRDRQLALTRAHEVCGLLLSGKTTDEVRQQMVDEAQVTEYDATQFIAAAVLVYPNC